MSVFLWAITFGFYVTKSAHPCRAWKCVCAHLCLYLPPCLCVISQMGMTAGHREGIWWYGMILACANMSKLWFMTLMSAATATGKLSKERVRLLTCGIFKCVLSHLTLEENVTPGTFSLNKKKIRSSSSVIWTFFPMKDKAFCGQQRQLMTCDYRAVTWKREDA